eukprot:Nk52_evm85s221 gene=Nk52_evmTU85s221
MINLNEQNSKEKVVNPTKIQVDDDLVFEKEDDFAHLRTAGVSSTAITIVCSMVGAGMLSLPAAFARMGWILGSIMIGLVGLFGMYAGLLLVKCLNTLDSHGKRIRSYPDLGEVCFGKTGRYIAHFGTYGTCVGVGILFLILSTDSFRDLTHEVSATAFTCISAVIVIPSIFTKTLHGASFISTIGLLAAFLMALIVVAENIYFFTTGGKPGKTELVHPDITDFGYAFTTIIFSYGGVCCFPELASLMKTPEKFPKAIFSAFPLVLCIYYLVSTTSYAAYGVVLYEDEFSGNVANNIPDNFGRTIISVAIIVHVLCAYIVYMNPFFREIEISYGIDEQENAFAKRSILRLIIVGLTLLVAIVIPFFGDVVSLLGATTQSLSCVLIPIACYWKMYGRATWSRGVRGKLETVLQVFIFLVVVVAGVLGTIIAVKNIIDKSSTYHFF